MFAQVIQGKVSDPESVKAATDRWVRDLAPGADGWLGSTGGTTDGSWWTETEKLFDGEATFQDCNDVTLDLHGDPNQAGFVQIMQGRGTDPDRARELMAEDSDEW